jgi:AMP nucleosidase
VIFTNYQFYVDMFARLSRERMVSGHADSDAFVEPGNVITRNARLGGGTAGVALGVCLKCLPYIWSNETVRN